MKQSIVMLKQNSCSYFGEMQSDSKKKLKDTISNRHFIIVTNVNKIEWCNIHVIIVYSLSCNHNLINTGDHERVNLDLKPGNLALKHLSVFFIISNDTNVLTLQSHMFLM